MNERLTPLHLKLLLHAYVSPETYDPWSDTAANYYHDLLRMGAVELIGDNFTKYSTTPLGRAWIAAILDTPLPRMAYLDATGKEITP